MTPEEYYDDLYGKATGWARYSHQDAMQTPIPFILLALKGAVDFSRISSPFGVSKTEPTKDPTPDQLKAKLGRMVANYGG